MDKCKECGNRIRLIDGGVQYVDKDRCLVCLKKLLKSEKRKNKRLQSALGSEHGFRNAIEAAGNDWPEAPTGGQK